MKSSLVAVILGLTTLLSCTNRSGKQRSDIIAQINGEDISSSQIDQLIQQELYDELNRIYNIKSKALDSYIDLTLLQQQAKIKNLSVDEYVDEFVTRKIEAFGLDSLYSLYQLGERVTFHAMEMYTAANDTLGESLALKYKLKYHIIQELTDSLRRKSDIAKYLYPPKNPTINLKDLLVFYRGKMNSNVVVYVISDFDCNKCIESHSIYDSLYTNYKEKVKFGYINFSATPTLAQIACSAANEQGAFWEYHDSLYKHETFIDSVVVYTIAQQINLDINKFHNDIRNEKISDEIDKTIQKLVERGIFATPTVVVNKRLIYNSNSYDEISHLIDMELSDLSGQRESKM